MGAPVLVGSVKVVRSNRLRAVFDQIPQASDGQLPGDAMNPANWVFRRKAGGAAPVVRAVSSRADDTFVSRSAQRSVTDLDAARTDHAVITLPDGRILVIGGRDGATYRASVALFDPATGLWAARAAMPAPRARFAAVLLHDGRILVAGGATTGGASIPATWVYDPRSDTWRTTRNQPSATISDSAIGCRLADGRALIVDNSTTPVLFDAEAELFTATTGFTTARTLSTLSLLRDGRVVLIGGYGAGAALNNTRILDPATAAWVAGPNLATARAGHVAVTLNDGRVFVYGGVDTAFSPVSSGEILKASADSFSSAGAGPTHGFHAGAVKLADGKVLIVGGASGSGVTDTFTATTRFDPATSAYEVLGGFPVAHSSELPFLAKLASGDVLAIGGEYHQVAPPLNIAIATVDVFRASTSSWSIVFTDTTVDPLLREVELALGSDLQPGVEYVLEGRARIEGR